MAKAEALKAEKAKKAAERGLIKMTNDEEEAQKDEE
jgi:hypothetical protein